MPQGFVIDDNETNEEYLDSFSSSDDWAPVILDTHAKLVAIDPDYRITQIKGKFNELRYYYHSDFPWTSDERIAMEELVRDAEDAVRVIEEAKRV